VEAMRRSLKSPIGEFLTDVCRRCHLIVNVLIKEFIKHIVHDFAKFHFEQALEMNLPGIVILMNNF